MNRNFNRLRAYVVKHTRVLMPLILLVAVVITVGTSLALRRHAKASRRTEVTARTVANAKDVVLEKNEYQEVNNLFQRYYDAMVGDDTAAIEAMSAELSEEEKIRIDAVSTYIDSYPSIDVYTKTGPVDHSYVCYVVTTMKFKDHDWKVPGLQTMYVCTGDDGKLYINNAQDQDKRVADYIQTVSLQDDVVDLNNKVTAEYNKLVADNSDLSSYLNETSTSIDLEVGQKLAELQKETGKAQTAESNTPEADREYLKANDIVNVRKSAGEDGEIIGTTAAGSRYELVSRDATAGWSEIIFNGQTGYVKTDFFEFIPSENEQKAAEDKTAEDQSSKENSDSQSTEAAEASTEKAETGKAGTAGTAADNSKSTGTSDASSNVEKDADTSTTGDSKTVASAEGSSEQASSGDTRDATAGGTKSADSAADAAAKSDDTPDVSAAAGEEKFTGKAPKTAVALESVAIRAKASADSDKVATAYPGAKLTVVKYDRTGWTEVNYKGQNCYVKSQYFRFTD